MTARALEDAIAHHFQSVIDKRLEAIVDRYWPDEHTYVFVEGPRWSTKGSEKVAAGWRAFVAAPLAVTSCTWVEGPSAEVVGAMGWIAGIVELGVVAGGRDLRVRFRGSFVLRLADDGQWRVVHEHFSQPAPDPYGIGDWLPSTS